MAADGPRDGKIDEKGHCEEVRKIATSVDWPCEVKTLFREENLGCRRGVSGAIDWFFKHESEGIILEDDVVPSVTFFRFCQELLERYRHDERVMSISGNNFQGEHKVTSNSYYFSRYNHLWGWATWKRAWKHYDHEMVHWPKFRDSNGLKAWSDGNESFEIYWNKIFNICCGDIDTWDCQWVFSC